jgi:hypothetical protein
MMQSKAPEGQHMSVDNYYCILMQHQSIIVPIKRKINIEKYYS